VAVAAAVCYGFKDRPLRLALGLGAVLLAGSYRASLQKGTLLHVERSFFGVSRVVIEPSAARRRYIHGGTVHGSQSLDPSRSHVPLTYYHPKGPVGDVFSAFGAEGTTKRVAVIGLGTGSVAAYAKPGQHFTFYEIDPVVARIASAPRYFTFLQDCPGIVDIVLGDGRLTLARAPDRHYGLILLDAFSSDAIPTHLVTQEALKLYLAKLEPGGWLVFHVSNRYLDLKPLLGNLAVDAGLVCLYRRDVGVSETDAAEGKLPSEYVAMARSLGDLGSLPDSDGWKPVRPRPELGIWTDQYSNILSVFRWRHGSAHRRDRPES
jgi:hypothetical protein